MTETHSEIWLSCVHNLLDGWNRCCGALRITRSRRGEDTVGCVFLNLSVRRVKRHDGYTNPSALERLNNVFLHTTVNQHHMDGRFPITRYRLGCRDLRNDVGVCGTPGRSRSRAKIVVTAVSDVRADHATHRSSLA